MVTPDLVLEALARGYADGSLTLEEFERRVDLHLRQVEVQRQGVDAILVGAYDAVKDWWRAP